MTTRKQQQPAAAAVTTTTHRRKLPATALVLATLIIITAPVPSIQGKKTVTVTNFLPNTVTVHCQSKNNDLGFHDVGLWDEYSWSFGTNAFGGTLFWCNLKISKTNQCLHFDAFVQSDGDHVRYWEVHGVDGITGKTEGGRLVKEVASWRGC